MKPIKDWVRMKHREDWVLLARLVERNLLSVARGLDLAGRFSPGDCLRTLVRFLPYANNDQVAGISLLLVEKARKLELPTYDDENASYKRELCTASSTFCLRELLKQGRLELVSSLVSEFRDDVVTSNVRDDLVEKSLTNPGFDLSCLGSLTDRLLSLSYDRQRSVLGRMLAEAPNLVSGLDLKELPLDMLALVADGAKRQDLRRSALNRMLTGHWLPRSRRRSSDIVAAGVLIKNGVLCKPSNWDGFLWFRPATILLALLSLVETGQTDIVKTFVTSQSDLSRVGLAEALVRGCRQRGLHSDSIGSLSQIVRDECRFHFRVRTKEAGSRLRRFIRGGPMPLPNALESCGALYETHDAELLSDLVKRLVQRESRFGDWSSDDIFWGEFLLNCDQTELKWLERYGYETESLIVACECGLGLDSLISKWRSAGSLGDATLNEKKKYITKALFRQSDMSSAQLLAMIVKLATADSEAGNRYDHNYIDWCCRHLAVDGRIDLIRLLLANAAFISSRSHSTANVLFEQGLEEDAMRILAATVHAARTANAGIRPHDRDEGVDCLISECAKCASRHGHSDFAAGLLVPWEGWLRWFYEATEEVLPHISAASARRLLETLSSDNEWGLENYPAQRLGEYDWYLHRIMSSLQVRSTEMSLFEISQSPSFWWRKYASMHRAMPYSDDDLVDHAMQMCEYAPIEQLKTLAEIRKWL